MSEDTEWFEGRAQEQTMLPIPFWVLLVLAALLPLAGCASAPEEKPICAVQFLGQTPNSVSVVRLQCITEKEFAELNK